MCVKRVTVSITSHRRHSVVRHSDAGQAVWAGRFAPVPDDGPQEGAQFGWLYGGKGRPPEDADPEATRAVPRQPSEPPPADATRMMPTQPRPDTPRTTRPTPPRPAPPVVPPASGPPPRRRRRFRFRYVLLVLRAWIVYLVSVPVVSLNTVYKVELQPGGGRPSEQAYTA